MRARFCELIFVAAICSANAQGRPSQAGASASNVPSVLPKCVANATNVWLPDPDSGKCYCGTHSQNSAPAYSRHCLSEGLPALEKAGLSKRGCIKDGADMPLDSTAVKVCDWYCMCGDDSSQPIATCCQAGRNFGLKSNTIIALPTSEEPQNGEAFLPVPSKSVAVLPLIWCLVAVAIAARSM